VPLVDLGKIAKDNSPLLVTEIPGSGELQEDSGLARPSAFNEKIALYPDLIFEICKWLSVKSTDTDSGRAVTAPSEYTTGAPGESGAPPPPVDPATRPLI